jgi:outer membrane protein TolC
MKRTSIILFVSLFTSSACVHFDVKQSLSATNSDLPEFTNGNLELLISEDQKKNARKRTDELLATELSLSSAIEVALQNSPAVQVMLTEYWEQSSDIALSGSIPNPVFEFARISSDSELEIERLLSIGLLDLIRLPVLRRKAELKLDANRLALSGNVVEHITEVRNAWVNAVAEQQLATYAQQVFSSAEASAKLAANMQAIGNFSALSRAKQQGFYANAATNLAIARHSALAAREALVRVLGLDTQQAASLILPERLQELPDTPISTEVVSSAAANSRLDVQMGLADVKIAGYAQGITLLGEVTDIEIAGISETVWEEAERESSTGFEIGIELPIFRSVSKVRDRLNAKSLLAINRLEGITRSASSHLREAYSSYRSSYDIAKHYRDEIVPLQKVISEENVLKYNGMIIGIFELLADSRAQIEAVQSAIKANKQFWMADAALRSSMIGKPTAMVFGMSAGGGESGGEEH